MISFNTFDANIVLLANRCNAMSDKFPPDSTSRSRLLDIANKLHSKGYTLDVADARLLLVLLADMKASDVPSDPAKLLPLLNSTFCIDCKMQAATPVVAPAIPQSSAASKIGEAVLSVLTEQIESISRQVSQAVTREEMTAFAEGMADTLQELASRVSGKSAFTISVNSCPPVELDGYVHPEFSTLLACCANRINVLLVGPAGTGKTSMAKAAAKALGIERVVAQSFCSQTPESRLFGYQDANGNYVRTKFRDCYEKGGVYILDEMDSASPNVLTSINAAIDNGECTFPDKVVSRHADFICIACANTYGNGADRQYVGRAQLDGATLNRFAKLAINYDINLDKALSGQPFQCETHPLTPVPESQRLALGKQWCDAVLAARKVAQESGIRVIISPRQTRDGFRLLCSGVPTPKVISMLLTSGLSKVDQDKIGDAALNAL